MSDTSSIILTGRILPDRQHDDVVVALAKLLKTTDVVAAGLLSGRETVIKRSVTEADLERYLRALAAVGAEVRLQPPVSRAPATPPASPAATRPPMQVAVGVDSPPDSAVATAPAVEPPAATAEPANARAAMATSPSVEEPTFFVKHWRGEYSLGVAYWMIGVLLTIVVVALCDHIGASETLRDAGPAAMGASIVAMTGVVLAMTIWQLVGIWRSAEKHTTRGGSGFWAGAAKLVVAIGFLRAIAQFVTTGLPSIDEGFGLLAGSDHTPVFQLRLLRDGTEMELAGGIPFGTTKAVVELLDSSSKVRIVHLNSQGGRIGEALRLHDAIKARGLNTYTSTDCVSACAIAFMAGKERYLGDKGRVGFHSTSFASRQGQSSSSGNDRFRRFLRAKEVPEEFIDRALRTPPNEMWYPSHDELTAARVVHAVVDSRRFAISGITNWQDETAIEAELLKNPLYAAMASHDQANYQSARTIFVSGVQQGRSVAGIQRDLRSSIFEPLLPVYLRKASDEALLRYWRSQVAEMRFLKDQNVQACADFAFPQFAGGRTHDFQRLFPKELAREDIDALAEVIKSASVGHSPSAANDQAELVAAVRRVAAASPQALKVLQRPREYQFQPGALCHTSITLYTEILSMPESRRAARALRAMMKS